MTSEREGRGLDTYMFQIEFLTDFGFYSRFQSNSYKKLKSGRLERFILLDFCRVNICEVIQLGGNSRRNR